MMDVEVQIRPHGHPSRPADPHLSMDERLAHGDRLREAKKRLEDSLRDIDQAYTASLVHQSHSGQEDCERCRKKKADIARAYYSFYLDSDPNSWTLHASSEYRRRLDSMFNDSRSSLDDFHATFRSGIRDYLKQNFASTGLSQQEVAELFVEQRSTNDILSTFLERAHQRAPNPDAAAFIVDLQDTKTPQARVQVYIKYYCNSSWDDSSSVKNFKAKYARMFEQLVPYDEVVAAMRKEAEESQSSKLAGLRRQLNELEMAQSAHLKAKARKDQKRRDREPTPGVVQCSLIGCANEVDLATDETIECAVCEWLERKGGEKGRAFYCCMEHADEDFEEHDRHDHQCCMGGRCLYYPQSGPPGETDAGGVCQDCADEDFTSYFCSQDCYHNNLELHREDYHMGKGIHNDSDNLEMFRPADDMEITS